MELDELTERLAPFAAARYGREDVAIEGVHTMPGHAGFSWGFDVVLGEGPDAGRESWFIRLPPPNVNWRGTADVLRQVEVLNALDGTDVPHCSVQWSGADLEWFGCPYFVVPKLEGDVLRLGPGEWTDELPDEIKHDMGRQVMQALAGIHAVDHAKTPYLGDPVPFNEDVERWDRFFERAADPELLARAPDCRRRLLETLPEDAPVGIFHGDFQTSNVFFEPPPANGEPPKLLAVIDWELTGIGATLNDVGWICTFSDRAAWAANPDGGAAPRPSFLDPDTLMSLYVEAWGKPLPNLSWFRALAAYKFAIITGFNLSLHRRGKRVDPSWEITRLSMPTLIDRALELLG
ncbi:MAG: phosphotransferase family protein [Gammaproteobacteria bacterium]|nr:phosphotransferase family protein [Gammaproteobacteria bacterium]MYB38704.1 phosphotransferase family protein [Gammaproteobacteria bacterium]